MQTSFVAAALASFERLRGNAPAAILVALSVGGCAAPEHETAYERGPAGEEARERARQPLSPSEPIFVGIAVENGVYDTELMVPCGVFGHSKAHARQGMTVFTVARTKAPVESFGGLRLIPDHDYASAPRIDILVLPGTVQSRGTDGDDRELLEFVRERAQRARYVVALECAAFVLARAGVLTDHSCTTSPSDAAELKRRFPELDVQTEVSFVQSGRVITSQGGVRSYDVALYLTELIYGMDVAEGIGRRLSIDWNLGRVPYIGTIDEPTVHDDEKEREREEARERKTDAERRD